MTTVNLPISRQRQLGGVSLTSFPASCSSHMPVPERLKKHFCGLGLVTEQRNGAELKN